MSLKLPSEKLPYLASALFKTEKLFSGLSKTTSVEANPLDEKSLDPAESSPKLLAFPKVNLNPFVP